ncbi:MAG: sulfite exporter TauE/SafE family protein [Acidobacteriota bacterium]|nr:sulfite exporter TauE/SafE family protein [Acidobacteriota bacterium]
MLIYVVIGTVALAVAGLTLFSGFGLGTLLMPAFALFFPLPVAVAATAIVHFLNGLFKLSLLYRSVVPRVLARFGLPAIVSAPFGAFALTALARQEALHVWSFGGRTFEISPVKLVLGVVILGFALAEFAPPSPRGGLSERWLPLGGVLSGFFGGLSGHQGALRAIFLSSLDLSPASFAATQAAIATMVDVARLAVYGGVLVGVRESGSLDAIPWRLVAFAAASAFAGSFVGTRLLTKVTIRFVRYVTGALLAVVGGGLASGVF